MKISRLLTALCLAGALPFQCKMEKPFLSTAIVIGKSCEPVIQDSNEISYSSIPSRLGLLERKDFIVARVGNEDYLKRIEGIPGDTIVQSLSGVYVNGKKIYEYDFSKNPRLKDSMYENGEWVYPRFKETKLLEDEYFLMGPNIYHSKDSREFGPIRKKDICGKVLGDF